MSEVKFTEAFLIHTNDGHVRTGHVMLEAAVPILLADHAAACEAMERIKTNLHRLIVQQDLERQGTATGQALEPALITAKLPGVDITDRRRGPRGKGRNK